MAKSKTEKDQEIELAPDAWQRFERAVDVVAKGGPQHRAHKPQDDPPKAPKVKKDKPAK